MNPTQGSGKPSPAGSQLPLEPTSLITDISEDAFGFADDAPEPSKARPAAAQLPPPVRPAPANPPSPVPQQTPLPAPTTVPAQSMQPAPQPLNPTDIPTPPAQQAPAPVADIMPPQKMPTTPTLTPPAAPPSPLVPPLVARPQPPGQHTAFDPGTIPAHASSMSENPITASFSPGTNTHVPDDIAKRIGEHPIQNSEDVLRLAKHGFDIRRVKSVLSFLFFTAGIFVAAFLINQFIFQSYYVEGTSMTPTLQNNDRLIISKVERTLSAIQGQPYIPERGQVIVLDSSIVGINGQKEQLIKRVIGLPGDHLHVENGIVTIENAQHPDGYDVTEALGLTNLQPTYSESPIDLIVPANHVYVMGDNREQGGSQDSRIFGPVGSDKIQGRLWARILPLDKAQIF